MTLTNALNEGRLAWTRKSDAAEELFEDNSGLLLLKAEAPFVMYRSLR